MVQPDIIRKYGDYLFIARVYEIYADERADLGARVATGEQSAQIFLDRAFRTSADGGNVTVNTAYGCRSDRKSVV